MMVHSSSACSSISESRKTVLPSYIPYSHPSTKWLLNTFRNGASHRLTAMLKERPQLFRHTFQVPDNPCEVLADPSDTKPMFNISTQLYFKPLSLAVYMKCKSAILVLLSSGTSEATEYGYATEVFVQAQANNIGDLLELFPACIAVRRQFLEGLPLLYTCTRVTKTIRVSPRSSFTIRYISKRLQKTVVYDDIFHYTTELAQNNRNVNIVRTLDTLVNQCPGFYELGGLNETRTSERYSLFRRLVHFAVYIDIESRICFPLIQCMELLVRLRHFNPNSIPSIEDRENKSFSTNLTFRNLQSQWNSLDEWSQDVHICLAQLFGLYARLLQRTKSGCISHAGNLLFHVLQETSCLESALNLCREELAATLDFIINKDIPGKELHQDRKVCSLSKSHSAVESGDDNYLQENKSTAPLSSQFCNFSQVKDLLSLIQDKLRARSNLAHFRQMHLLSLAKSFRGNNVHVSKHSRSGNTTCFSDVFHQSEPLTSPLDRAANAKFRQRCRGRWNLSRKKSQTESLALGSRSSHARTGCEKYLRSPTVKSGDSHSPESCKAHLSNIPIITTTDVDEEKNSMEDDSSKSNLALMTSPAHLHPYENSDERSLLDSCKLPFEYSQAVMKNELQYEVQQLASLPIVEVKEHEEDPPSEPNEEKVLAITLEAATIQTQPSSSDVFLNTARENLSLQDVDQLIECIASTALANEPDLDSKLLEDLFTDYLQPSVANFRGITLGGQCGYMDQEEATKLVLAESWNCPTEIRAGNRTDSERTVCSNVHTMNMPEVNRPTEVLHEDDEETSDAYIPQLAVLQPHGLRSSTSDPLSPTCHRRFLWSCAKPMCHLNSAWEHLKSRSQTRRSTLRNSSSNTPCSSKFDTLRT